LRRRGWFRPKKAAESDAVLTARMSRQVTIATSLITAMVGITGTITAADISANSAARQVAQEDARALRTQIQTAYADFTDQIGAMIGPLSQFIALFEGVRHPTLNEVDPLYKTIMANSDKLAQASNRVSILASGPAAEAASNAVVRYDDLLDGVRRARDDLAEGSSPRPEDISRWNTQLEDVVRLDRVFEEAASADLRGGTF
jgi:hypothetical protein